jgi:ATP/maltotriose-dependent transcriptional regulator MalT
MNGDFETARELIRDTDAILDDLGRVTQDEFGRFQSTVSFHEAWVDMLAGEPADAEAKLRADYLKLEAMGDKSVLSTMAASLAQAAFAQGHDEDAVAYRRVAERTAAADDLHAQATWRSVGARILARRGQFDAGEVLAREAVQFTKRTDFVTTQADSLFDLGAVLDGAGRKVDSEAAVREALELYVEKGNIVSAERALSWLATRGFSANENGDQK